MYTLRLPLSLCTLERLSEHLRLSLLSFSAVSGVNVYHRDREEMAMGGYDHIPDSEFMDRTDKENQEFRYSY